MTNYVCTCGASHDCYEWDESTTRFYGPGCISISDPEKKYVDECTFICPTCGNVLDGDAIAVVEE